jgi:hypothetical protein
MLMYHPDLLSIIQIGIASTTQCICHTRQSDLRLVYFLNTDTTHGFPVIGLRAMGDEVSPANFLTHLFVVQLIPRFDMILKDMRVYRPS